MCSRIIAEGDGGLPLRHHLQLLGSAPRERPACLGGRAERASRGASGANGSSVLVGAIGRECGNESFGPLKGNHQLDGF